MKRDIKKVSDAQPLTSALRGAQSLQGDGYRAKDNDLSNDVETPRSKTDLATRSS